MRRILGAALILALGCGDDKNNSTTDGGTGGSTGGTSEGTTNPTTTTSPTASSTTDDSGTMGGSETKGETETSPTTGTSEPMTTGPMTSGPMTTGETTGGGGSIEDECAAACDKFNSCMIGPPDQRMCVPSCLDDLGGGEGECLAATEAYLTCLAGMTCEELMALDENDDPGPCLAALTKFSEVCQGGGDCAIGQGGNPQMTECSVSIDCQGEPLLEMQCDKNECVCLVDGMQQDVSCPSEMICQTPDVLLEKAGECCGF